MLVFGEILSFSLPTQRPWVLDATETPNKAELQNPTKRAPKLGHPFVNALGSSPVDINSPDGDRTYAASYILTRLASPRFPGAKVAFHFWIPYTAARGIALDVKRHSRPLIEWGAPSTAFGLSAGGRVDALVNPWSSDPPVGWSRDRFSILPIKSGRPDRPIGKRPRFR